MEKRKDKGIEKVSGWEEKNEMGPGQKAGEERGRRKLIEGLLHLALGTATEHAGCSDFLILSNMSEGLFWI